MSDDDEFVMEMIFDDPTPNSYINKRINNAFTLNLDKVDLNQQEREQFMRLTLMVAKKLAMTWRHLNRYREIDDRLVAQVKDTPLRVDGKRTGFDYSDDLYAEFDGFLAQVKSTLDHLVHVPTPVFGPANWRPHTFGEKGNRVIKMLERNAPKEFAAGIPLLCDMIRWNQRWMQETIDIRDKTNHFKDGGVPYEYFRVAKDERDGQEVLVVPMWSKDVTARDALGGVWRKLICLCEEFIGFTLYLRLKFWMFRYTRIEDEGECYVDEEMEDPRWEFMPDFESMTRNHASP